MAHLSTELREQLRDDLMKTVGTAMRDELPKALRIALIEIMDNHAFDSIDRMLDSFFEQDGMDCWLSFDRDGPHVLCGIGPGDCAASFDPELCIETYFRDGISREQEQEILDQLVGLKAFIAKLEESRAILEARAKVFTGRVTELPAQTTGRSA